MFTSRWKHSFHSVSRRFSEGEDIIKRVQKTKRKRLDTFQTDSVQCNKITLKFGTKATRATLSLTGLILILFLFCSTWLPAEDHMSVVLSERIKLVSGLETQYKPKDTNSELFEVSKCSLWWLPLNMFYT